MNQPTDTVRQYMVEAKIPKFTFFSAPGCAVDMFNLSPGPLFKAFETPGTIEFFARRSFFLNLFGANTAPITVSVARYNVISSLFLNVQNVYKKIVQ